MAITVKEFGQGKNGEGVSLYTIKNNNGMEASVTNYGAILVELIVPDKKGDCADVVLGKDDAQGYYVNDSFLGATVGPIANRTEDASVEINGKIYHLEVNDNQNNLHSHME